MGVRTEAIMQGAKVLDLRNGREMVFQRWSMHRGRRYGIVYRSDIKKSVRVRAVYVAQPGFDFIKRRERLAKLARSNGLTMKQALDAIA